MNKLCTHDHCDERERERERESRVSLEVYLESAANTHQLWKGYFELGALSVKQGARHRFAAHVAIERISRCNYA